MNNSFYPKIERIKEELYYLGVDILAFFKKTAVFISLPIKFIQFWKEAWNKSNNSNEDN